jgi:restriction system protein
LAKAGLVELTKRAHFRITDRGKALLARGLDRVDNAVLEQFPEFQEFRTRDSSVDAVTTSHPAIEIISKEEARTPDEIMRAAQGQINSALGKELLRADPKSC